MTEQDDWKTVWFTLEGDTELIPTIPWSDEVRSCGARTPYREGLGKARIGRVRQPGTGLSVKGTAGYGSQG